MSRIGRGSRVKGTVADMLATAQAMGEFFAEENEDSEDAALGYFTTQLLELVACTRMSKATVEGMQSQDWFDLFGKYEDFVLVNVIVTYDDCDLLPVFLLDVCCLDPDLGSDLDDLELEGLSDLDDLDDD